MQSGWRPLFPCVSKSDELDVSTPPIPPFDAFRRLIEKLRSPHMSCLKTGDSDWLVYYILVSSITRLYFLEHSGFRWIGFTRRRKTHPQRTMKALYPHLFTPLFFGPLILLGSDCRQLFTSTRFNRCLDGLHASRDPESR